MLTLSYRKKDSRGHSAKFCGTLTLKAEREIAAVPIIINVLIVFLPSETKTFFTRMLYSDPFH